MRVARFDEVDARTMYGLLRLRTDVFVVEQECAYPELDGLDLLPDTLHVWRERGGEPIAYLRILDLDGELPRIGRVAVARQARGEGLAGELMKAALDQLGDRPAVLNAQSYLVEFYRRFGFEPTGPEFLDDGIPHTPMARPRSAR